MDREMWRLKQLIPKEQAGLEGKTVDVGPLRLQIRNTIAEGGFSCVYLARDAQSGKQFALKHIVCNDAESLDLVKKEVNALKELRGHPNIIDLHAQAMYDNGRSKECFLAMEYCEKTMVEYLDSRGAGFLEENQLLIMFREICNAIYAMHSLSPPMAHRDLKAENLLLGSDGKWKLCDFGSVSTNHKRFEKAAEMGIEEDIIRKHTTPAYRAPEMWDLYQRELISEKVDIWALGCLLFRMAYLKSAFDGDSKLQILNGNYRIPDQPMYSSKITGLIRDLLNASPEARPTAMQIWLRVNSALSPECQKASQDKAPSSATSQENSVQGRSAPGVPTRTPPPPPRRNADRGSPSLLQKETEKKFSPSAAKETDFSPVAGTGKGGALGSFWSTQYAQAAVHQDGSHISPQNDSGLTRLQDSLSPHGSSQRMDSGSPSEPWSMRSNFVKNRKSSGRSYTRPGEDEHVVTVDENANESEASFKKGSASVASPTGSGSDNLKQKSEEAFSDFVADFQRASIFSVDSPSLKHEGELEVERLRNELKQAERERDGFASKYDKLVAICRSQRLEIQELKTALTAANSHPVPSKSLNTQSHPSNSSQQTTTHSEAGTIWDLQQGFNSSVSLSENQGWKAFDESPSKATLVTQRGFDQEASLDDIFGSKRFENTQSLTGSPIGSLLENTQKQKSSEAWSLHDGFATHDSGSMTKKGIGQGFQGEGVAGKLSFYNGNAMKGASRSAASTYNSQPSGWSNF
ncbi:hypothetical protein KP509_32G020800 [Ceratopteris richardii]|uniref:non-specific serine/threonine protein kinase n=1 Tax=Ceratopteris richardii TaxID=49495 RepID=A0A8T2QRD4_CERRI|nr:hypothetical protein KP509_32G020800 [Ceratopteris richardii]